MSTLTTRVIPPLYVAVSMTGYMGYSLLLIFAGYVVVSATATRLW